MIVHQIYGLFGDNKPMSELFKASSKAWEEYCDKNNHIYKLWNEKECNELVDTYSKIKEYYYDVKYPVMKCDIMRFLIIYQFGGLYVDLDCLPNTDEDFIINKNELYLCNYLWTPNKELEDKPVVDIELIYSPKYNNDLYNYLLYIPTQIIEKNETLPDSWKIRYIFQTTGPVSFRRYLKLNKIKHNLINTCGIKKEIKYGDLEGVDINKEFGNQDYKIISYFSLSYNPHGNKNMKYNNKKKVKISEVVENI